MATFTKFYGAARGKIGGIVFSKGDNGMVYGRAYQPQVNNPKSVAQTDQRAKMNLSGRLSKATPNEVLMGMPGSNNRQRRSLFSSIILKAITLDKSDPSTVTAQLNPADVVFSMGAEPLMSHVSTAPAVTASRITMGLTSSDINGYGERIVCAIIDPSDKAGYNHLVFADVLFTENTEVSLNIDLVNPLVNGSMVCVYRIPFRLNELGRSNFSQLYNDGVNMLASATLTPSVIKAWGDSVHTANVVFTQA